MPNAVGMGTNVAIASQGIPSFLAPASSGIAPAATAASSDNRTTQLDVVSVTKTTIEHETGNWKSRLLNKMILVLVLCLVGFGILAQRRANMAAKAKKESEQMEKEMASSVELPPPPAIPSEFAQENKAPMNLAGPVWGSSDDSGPKLQPSQPEETMRLELGSPEPNVVASEVTNQEAEEPEEPYYQGGPITLKPAADSNASSQWVDPSNSVSRFNPGSQDSSNLEAPSLIGTQDAPSSTESITETKFRNMDVSQMLAARQALQNNRTASNGNANTQEPSGNTYLTSSSTSLAPRGYPDNAQGIGGQPGNYQQGNYQPSGYQPIGIQPGSDPNEDFRGSAQQGMGLQGRPYPDIPNSLESISIPSSGPVGPPISGNQMRNSSNTGNPSAGYNPAAGYNPSSGFNVQPGMNAQPGMNGPVGVNGSTGFGGPSPRPNPNVAPPRTGYGGVNPGGPAANYGANPSLSNPPRPPYQGISNQLQGPINNGVPSQPQYGPNNNPPSYYGSTPGGFN